MTALQDILDRIREETTDDVARDAKRERGDRFERLIAAYLRTDPYYSELLEDVWQWGEWPDHSGPDLGVDIVVRTKTDEYWAIQCKFFGSNTQLDKDHLDSFITASGAIFSTNTGDKKFVERYLVTTAQNLSANAVRVLKKRRDVPVKIITQTDLENSSVDWEKVDPSSISADLPLREPFGAYTHQKDAISGVIAGYEECAAEERDLRGQMIMACGTGKTFTSLRIMEQLVPSDGLVLFLVPSLSLVAQTLREWTAQAEPRIYAFVVCSDVRVGRGAAHSEEMRVEDLAYPSTTDERVLASEISKVSGRRRVIFSTYHSVEVLEKAQKEHGLGCFDLVICDEAHRTTGIMRQDDKNKKDLSYYLRVHDEEHIKAKRRLYMTATPRVYAEKSKARANDQDAVLYSMDDEARFGREFYTLSFAEAVDRQLLSDYKVIIVAVDETLVDSWARWYNTKYVEIEDSSDKKVAQLSTDFAARLFGCWKGLSKTDLLEVEDSTVRPATADNAEGPMSRAVAFTRTIKGSKQFKDIFTKIQNPALEPGEPRIGKKNDSMQDLVNVNVGHVDGTMNSITRNKHLDWLKGSVVSNACHILSNARCLAEGVDVPSLDGVVFFDTRESVIDIIQAIGRVMRKTEGKTHGYVILPVCLSISEIIDYDKKILGNSKFKGIWKVLKALRSHDESLVAEAEYRDKIEVILERDNDSEPDDDSAQDQPDQETLKDILTSPMLAEAIYGAIPLKLGDREYWADWAGDVAEIATDIIDRLSDILENTDFSSQFDGFLRGLQRDLNPSLDSNAAIEMLAQHMITQPIFETLFEDYSFVENNPVSRSLQNVIDGLIASNPEISNKLESLDRFYHTVKRRVSYATDDKSKQELIRNLYDTFFNVAFPRVADRLGIAYTPIEIVDFVLKSAEHALQVEFGRNLSGENVHIMDPFTGSGSFIVRLLQISGLISDADIDRKFAHEIHANEILLLAYYIASVNIEHAFHARQVNATSDDTDKSAIAYIPFEKIVLTDSFQLYEGHQKEFSQSGFSAENSARAKRQKETPIRVIIGNPPWSRGQKSANDANKNLRYPVLEENIRNSYAAKSTATLKNPLYDSYIRAFRWASDRIGNEGVIAFVTNGYFIESPSADGVRQCLAEEFDAVWFVDLHGNIRTYNKSEGENIFGNKSMARVGITILVKNPNNRRTIADIHYHDIGNFLKRAQKIKILEDAKSIEGLKFTRIIPNQANDWINHRNPRFDDYIELGNDESKAGKPSGGTVIFRLFCQGVKTNRDPWVYNFNEKAVVRNMSTMIDFYNTQIEDWKNEKIKNPKIDLENFIDNNPHNISWSGRTKNDLAKQKKGIFDPDKIRPGIYRPFTPQYFYFDRQFNESVYRQFEIFPHTNSKNRVIVASGIGARQEFSALIVKDVPDLHLISNEQCFPRYAYTQDGEQHDNITPDAVRAFQVHYGRSDISADDIFDYTYGVLHAPDYRLAFAHNLKKQRPRLPFAPDFDTFVRAGRDLAKLHLNYQNAPEYPLTIIDQSDNPILETIALRDDEYCVEKMKWRNKNPKTQIIFNKHIRIDGIPPEAIEYTISGKSALDWIINNYQYKLHKKENIINDPNTWHPVPGDTAEPGGKYIISLIKRITYISVETTKIIKSLPKTLE